MADMKKPDSMSGFFFGGYWHERVYSRIVSRLKPLLRRSAVGQFVGVDLARFHLVADLGQLAADVLDLERAFHPERLIQRIEQHAEVAGDVDDLVRWRRRHVDAGAEVGHQQE